MHIAQATMHTNEKVSLASKSMTAIKLIWEIKEIRIIIRTDSAMKAKPHTQKKWFHIKMSLAGFIVIGGK